MILRRSFLIMLFICLSFSPAWAITGDEVLAKADDVFSAATDSTANAKMTLIDKSGKVKERKMKMWTKFFKDKDDWSVTKFTSPADVRNLGFLTLADDQMYLYLPAFDRLRRIASHARKESFAGSDLSNDDFSTGKYTDHYSSKIIEETGEFYKLELTRKPGSNRIYTKIICSVHKQHFYVTEMELYDENVKLWKTMVTENKQIQGYWTWTKIVMTDVRKDHKTVLDVTDIKFDTGLEDDYFTQRFLKRRVKGD